MILLPGVVRAQQHGAQLCGVIRDGGEGEGHSGSGFFRVVYQNGSPMQGGCVADQQHSKSNAVAAVLQTWLSQISGEQGGLIFFGNPTAGVCDTEAELLAAGTQQQMNRAACWSEFQRVRNHVQNRPLHKLPVKYAAAIRLQPTVRDLNACCIG